MLQKEKKKSINKCIKVQWFSEDVAARRHRGWADTGRTWCYTGLVVVELWHGLPNISGLNPQAWGPSAPREDLPLRHPGQQVFVGIALLSLGFCTPPKLYFRHLCLACVWARGAQPKSTAQDVYFCPFPTGLLFPHQEQPFHSQKQKIKLNCSGNLMHFRTGAWVWIHATYRFKKKG